MTMHDDELEASLTVDTPTFLERLLHAFERRREAMIADESSADLTESRLEAATMRGAGLLATAMAVTHRAAQLRGESRPSSAIGVSATCENADISSSRVGLQGADAVAASEVGVEEGDSSASRMNVTMMPSTIGSMSPQSVIERTTPRRRGNDPLRVALGETLALVSEAGDIEDPAATATSLGTAGPEALERSLRVALGETLAFASDDSAEGWFRRTQEAASLAETSDSFAPGAAVRRPVPEGEGPSLTLPGGLDGGLIHVLQMLGQEGFQNISLADIAPRRQGLSDDEISALRQVVFEETESQACAICLETFEQCETLIRLHCGHFFHVCCATGWLRRSAKCPMCRAEV